MPGHHIREWRLYRGLSIGQLEAKSGVDKANISRIERGKRIYTQPVIEALAEALNCTPEALLVPPPTDENQCGFYCGAPDARIREIARRASIADDETIDLVLRIIGWATDRKQAPQPLSAASYMTQPAYEQRINPAKKRGKRQLPL